MLRIHSSYITAVYLLSPTDRVYCYGPNNIPATANAVKYTVGILKDGSTTWMNVLKEELGISSDDFTTVTVSLSTSYVN